MPNPQLNAILGIDASGFRAGLTSSRASLTELDSAIRGTAAQIAVFEQGMAGGGTREQNKQLDQMRANLRELQIEYKNTARQAAAFQAAADLAPQEAGAKPPDESERHAAYWKRMEEQERSQRAQQAMADVLSAPAAVSDDSAAYEAHWKKSEEQNRSQRAREAMKASSDASDAAQKDKLAKLKQFQRERDALVRELKAREESERRSPSESAPSPGEDGRGRSSGSTHMRDQQLAHSARAVVDMLAAGMDPLRALEMEGPRLVQAFGGGLPALLGIGGAIVGMSMLIGKTVELGQAANELHHSFDLALNNDSTQGQQSIDALKKRVAELDAMLAEDPAPSSRWQKFKQGASDAFAHTYRQIGAFKDALFVTGDWSDYTKLTGSGEKAGDRRRKDDADAENLRAEKLKQIVAAEKEINDLKDEGFRHGQDTVRVAELELERKHKIADVEAGYGLPKLREELKKARTPEERERLQRELDDKSNAAGGGIAEVNREYDLKVAVTQIDIDRNAIARASATLQAGLGHVALTSTDGSVNKMQLPVGFDRYNMNLQKREADRSAAAATLLDAKSHGGDTKAAQLNLKRAESALRDAAVDEALKTPEQRRKDADTMRARQQAERRLAHPGTQDVDKEGSLIPVAGRNPLGAREAAGNASTFESRADRARKMHNAATRIRDQAGSLADQVRNGSENAGKGDAGLKDQGIIAAVKETTAAIKGIGLKNAP